MESKVSIVIPVFNAGLYIERCINSILVQSYADWELIIINDGSVDDSLELCMKYQLNDNRIFISNQINAGPSVARNKGIALATGKYLVFVDSDDYVHEYYLEKLLEPFLVNSAVEMSCGGYLELSKHHENGLALHDFQSSLNNMCIDRGQFFENIFLGVTGVLWGKMFLLDRIKKYKLVLDERIKLSEDLVFVFEYAIHVTKIALVKDHLYYYNRLNENGLSRQLNVSNLQDIQLSNLKISELSLKKQTISFTKALEKRFLDGVVNITKDIARSKNDRKKKIQDLTFVFSETKPIITTEVDLSIENKIHLNLFIKKQFLILIGFNSIICMLRNLKNKI